MSLNYSKCYCTCWCLLHVFMEAWSQEACHHSNHLEQLVASHIFPYDDEVAVLMDHVLITSLLDTSTWINTTNILGLWASRITTEVWRVFFGPVTLQRWTSGHQRLCSLLLFLPRITHLVNWRINRKCGGKIRLQSQRVYEGTCCSSVASWSCTCGECTSMSMGFTRLKVQ